MDWYVQVIIIVCYLVAIVGAGFIGHVIAKREEKNLENILQKINKLHK